MVIGNKNSFALEYEIHFEEPVLMAFNRIWIGSKFFGEPDNTGMLYQMYCVLEALVQKNGACFASEFIGKDPKDILIAMTPDLLDKNLRDFDRSNYEMYRYSFPENYDQFRIRIYAVNGIYHFIWKFFSEEIAMEGSEWVKDYSTEIQWASAAQSDIEYVFKELEVRFPEWK